MLHSHLATISKRLKLLAEIALPIAASALWPLAALAQESATPLPDAQLTDLAQRLARKANDVKCRPQDCTILVADLTLESGQTTALGMAVGDRLSEGLTSLGFQMIPRSAVRQFLEHERIPAKEMKSDEAIRWLGAELGAAAVVSGKTDVRHDSLKIIARVLSVSREGRTAKSKEESLMFDYPQLSTAMTPLDPYPTKGKAPPEEAGVERAGIKGVSLPTCRYCPLPEYTSAARTVQLSGSVLLDLLINSDGTLRRAKVVRGLPFGLTTSALDTVKGWKFNPATHNGQPVDVLVIVEVTFRIG